MIKINLLPKRKVKRVDKGEQSLMVGFLAVVAAGLLVFLFVHRPLQGELSDLQAGNSKLKKDNAELSKRAEGYAELKQRVDEAEKRASAIKQLDTARAVPAHVLHELARILTPNRMPTMTSAMAEVVRNNPNREMARDWDPKHVWITSFTEKKGNFRLEGGAQSDGDMTQLAMRLGASVYFDKVTPEGGVETRDQQSGISFYKFTISGKVIY